VASDRIDVLAIAAQDLLDNSVPDPDMLLSNLTVFSVMYFTQQTLDFAVRFITGLLINDPDSEGDDTADIQTALAAFVTANGNVNEACRLVGLFDETEAT
jgi:hypothetical protein